LPERVYGRPKKDGTSKETIDGIPWSLQSWQGAVIGAVILSGRPLSFKEIQENTGLDEGALNKAITDLRRSGEIRKYISKTEASKYDISDRFYSAYSAFYFKTELLKWLSLWKEVRKLDFPLEHEHFFLEGRHLDDFSKELISHAKKEVLLVNPFVQHCDLSNTLREASKNGIKVHIITRPPLDKYPEHLKRKEAYHAKLRQEGIKLVYNEKVHAKLVVADRAVAIVSSMNFYADSSAGVSWEAGLVSIDSKIVGSILDSLSKLA